MNIDAKDLHIKFYGKSKKLKAFRFDGSLALLPDGIPCVIAAWGETLASPGKTRFFGHYGKCPPGVYQLGKSIKLRQPERAYGTHVIPLVDINRLWKKYIPPRTLIRIHGGGKARDWRAPEQEQSITLGCQRVYNRNLIPLCNIIDACIDAGGTVWYTVTWDE